MSWFILFILLLFMLVACSLVWPWLKEPPTLALHMQLRLAGTLHCEMRDDVLAALVRGEG